MKVKRWILCPLLGFAAAQAMACYTVYDRSDRVVYQSEKPPVDMSRPIHETLPVRFPGAHMIFDPASECQVISSVATGAGARDMSSRSPLLTERRTAQAMGAPHTVLAEGIALVQPRDATLAPGVMVVPSAVAAVPSTAVMGAGPSRGEVITELRDPPLTIVESEGRVTVREPKR